MDVARGERRRAVRSNARPDTAHFAVILSKTQSAVRSNSTPISLARCLARDSKYPAQPLGLTLDFSTALLLEALTHSGLAALHLSRYSAITARNSGSVFVRFL